MAILPTPTAAIPIPTAVPDKWSDASFYDVTLTNIMCALISSGKYAPGPLIMQLAISATAELMYQTGRWVRPAGQNPIDLSQAQAATMFEQMGARK